MDPPIRSNPVPLMLFCNQAFLNNNDSQSTSLISDSDIKTEVESVNEQSHALCSNSSIGTCPDESPFTSEACDNRNLNSDNELGNGQNLYLKEIKSEKEDVRNNDYFPQENCLMEDGVFSKVKEEIQDINYELNLSINREIKCERVQEEDKKLTHSRRRSLRIGVQGQSQDIYYDNPEIETEIQLEGMSYEGTSSKSKFSSNMQFSQTSEVYECDICDMIFCERKDLKIHKETHPKKKSKHWKDLKKTFTCTICSKKYSKEGSLRVHVSREHSKKCTRKSHECPVCKKIYSTKKRLNEHLKWNHVNEKPYKCSICSKTFAWEGNLKEHMKTHTNDKKKHKCEECGKAFRYSYHLKRHKQVHVKEESPHQCSTCFKTFRDALILNQHMRQHTDSQTQQCKLCKKTFSLVRNFEAHMMSHSLEEKMWTSSALVFQPL